MPDRWERLLRIVTWGLAVVVVAQFLSLFVRRNPLTGLKTPTVPRWEVAETPPSGTNSGALRIGPGATNTSTSHPSNGTHTGVATNLVVSTSTNVAKATVTNATGTANAVLLLTNQLPVTNAVAGTNRPTLAMTNPVAVTNAPSTVPPAVPAGGPPPFAGSGPPGRRGSRASAPAKPLAPQAQARVDRITQSEMLAPVFRPPPMALLGIAGHDAFIRTPSGQATLLREGGESDGIKLLRLGTNRVLIEQAGEKKELMIFDGFGSESLLPK